MAESKQPSETKPKTDYSELPQKPITLKKGIGGLAGPVGNKTQTHTNDALTTAVVKQKKRAAVKKSSQTAQWTLRNFSKTAKDAAMEAANKEGVKLNEWLERAIYQALSASSGQKESDTPVREALEDIRVRLERIELQSGFLYRIWQSMKQWFA